jgi:superfamily I DNA/RNA helicase
LSKTTGVKPTEQQSAIITAAKTGGNGVVEAGAGTGKTATLTLIANAKPTERVLYVAYNKSIADEAKRKFPRNATCSTAHSLAFRAVGRNYADRLPTGPKGRRVTLGQTAHILGIHAQSFGRGDHKVVFPQNRLASLTMAAVRKFCKTTDVEPSGKHVAFFNGAEDFIEDLRAYLDPFIRRAWADVCNIDGRLRFDHDFYLKMWAMSNPTLNFDCILFDEAQDADPCTASVVESQSCQRIMVGDRNQAIYGWRGAVDAMSKFQSDWRLMLSQSFRFGPAVADEANKWLSILEADLRLTGFDKIDSTLGSLSEPDAVLCRTNAEAINQALMAQEDGYKSAIVGGTSEIQKFAEAAQDLQMHKPTSHPDLFVFESWEEVQAYVQEESGADLKVMVNLIDKYSVTTVLEVCKNSVTEDDADVTISTAHKAKGREWNSVKIASDFRQPEADPLTGEQTVNRDEYMLAYVSVTRAQIKLDREGLSWIDYMIGENNEGI